MSQRLDHLEHHRIAQCAVGDVEVTLSHDTLGQIPRRHLPVYIEMTRANVGDLALLEEPVTDHVAGTLPFRRCEQFHRCVQMRQVVLRMRDLRLVRPDPAEYLGTLQGQSLDDQRFRHADTGTHDERPIQPQTWCICYTRPQAFVPQAAVEALHEGVLHRLAP